MGLFNRKPNYDAFISYRRDGSGELARLIKAELEKYKIKTFLDVDNLQQSFFDEQLLIRITSTPNFILVLNDTSFDRCNDPNDWLRREIEQAIKTDRKIIPVFRQGYKFPDEKSLPGLLKDLPRYQSVGYSHEYHEASIQKLVHYLMEKPSMIIKPENTNVERETDIKQASFQEPSQNKSEGATGSADAIKIGGIRAEKQESENTKKIGKITIIKI